MLFNYTGVWFPLPVNIAVKCRKDLSSDWFREGILSSDIYFLAEFCMFITQPRCNHSASKKKKERDITVWSQEINCFSAGGGQDTATLSLKQNSCEKRIFNS